MKRQPKTPDASGGMHGHADKMLRMARAAASHHAPTSAELKLARHLAQAGASWPQIQRALGWNCCLATTINRLRKFNIFIRGGMNTKGNKRSKFGGETSLPHSENGISLLSYRPRAMGAAE